MEDKKTVEQRVAETILQKPLEVEIGGVKYTTAPPSTATLILASEAISRLPRVVLDPENALGESLSIAKDCKALGDVAAILILGARNITTRAITPQTASKRPLWGLFRKKRGNETAVDRKAALSKQIMECLTPKELNGLVADLLARMELGDFFGLTTFLTEINLLRQTKVEN